MHAHNKKQQLMEEKIPKRKQKHRKIPNRNKKCKMQPMREHRSPSHHNLTDNTEAALS
jgi:hypothetical protein